MSMLATTMSRQPMTVADAIEAKFAATQDHQPGEEG